MSQTTTEPRPCGSGGSGPDLLLPGYGDDGSGDGGFSRRRATARLGLYVALASISMLFATFCMACILRSANRGWMPFTASPLVFFDTAILLASSFTLEMARRRFESWRPLAFRRWLVTATALGSTFLVGQFLVCRNLLRGSVTLMSHPHLSYFLLFSGMHAVHVFAGILVLVYILIDRVRLLPGEASAPTLAAIYWHFMAALWLLLMATVLYF